MPTTAPSSRDGNVAGDHDDGSNVVTLFARAPRQGDDSREILEIFNSIFRSISSIHDRLAEAGIDPSDLIPIQLALANAAAAAFEANVTIASKVHWKDV